MDVFHFHRGFGLSTDDPVLATIELILDCVQRPDRYYADS